MPVDGGGCLTLKCSESIPTLVSFNLYLYEEPSRKTPKLISEGETLKPLSLEAPLCIDDVLTLRLTGASTTAYYKHQKSCVYMY